MKYWRTRLRLMSRPLILYHAQCADGFAAAWGAWRHFGDNADYLPVQYGQELPDVTERNVFILDFSYKRPVLLRMLVSANNIVIIDHHKTAEEELFSFQARGLFIRFDSSKSGGRLTWEHFHRDGPAPWLVAYTEDRDLWRWSLPNSREINAALASYPRDFQTWEQLAGADAGCKSWGSLIEQGTAILRYQQQQIEAVCAHARQADIAGHKVLAANTPIMQSEVAGKLAEGRAFGVAYFDRGDGKRVYSLRSCNGGLDVSEIAKLFGGGGHRNAAGFERELPCAVSPTS